MSRREFALGTAFLLAAGTAAARRPRRNLDLLGKAKLEDVIPDQIGGWSFVSTSGLVVPPEDQMSRALYSQLLTRVYSDGEHSPIMLLIAQSASETGILQIHRPEICYAAGGYKLSGVRRQLLPLPWGSLATVALSATEDAKTEQIVYWTRIGHHLPLSWAQQREAVAIDNLRGVIPDALLVRVSIVDPDPVVAFATIDRFVRALFESVAQPIRRFLIG